MEKRIQSMNFVKFRRSGKLWWDNTQPPKKYDRMAVLIIFNKSEK
jgi:hypothetical protein